MDNFNFQNPYKQSLWAKAEEFRGDGKQIKPLKFEVLKHGEGNPPANYVNPQNYTYRLTFIDVSGMTRIYENRYDSFAQAMKSNGIKPNVWGILTNYKDERGRWQWAWKILSSFDVASQAIDGITRETIFTNKPNYGFSGNNNTQEQFGEVKTGTENIQGN